MHFSSEKFRIEQEFILLVQLMAHYQTPKMSSKLHKMLDTFKTNEK